MSQIKSADTFGKMLGNIPLIYVAEGINDVEILVSNGYILQLVSRDKISFELNCKVCSSDP